MKPLIFLLAFFTFAASAQPSGTGSAQGIEVSVTSGLVNVQVGPTPTTSLSNVMTSQSDSQSAVNVLVDGSADVITSLLTVNVRETSANDNVASVETAFMQPLSPETESQASLNNADIAVDLTAAGQTITLVAFSGTALSNSLVAGPCGAAGGQTPTATATSSLTATSASILGTSLAITGGSTPQTIDAGLIADINGPFGLINSSLGVTGTVEINDRFSSASAGLGSADATPLRMNLTFAFVLLGIGTGSIDVDIVISASDAALACNGSPVELQTFDVD